MTKTIRPLFMCSLILLIGYAFGGKIGLGVSAAVVLLIQLI